MSIKDYINPEISKAIGNSFGTKGTLGYQLNETAKKGVSIALIGLNDTRNCYTGEFSFNTKIVREYLYPLSSLNNVNIVDYGDLIIGKTINDTYVAIKELVSELISENTIPVFFGGTQEIIIQIVQAIKNSTQQIEIAFIDSMLDALHENNDFHSQSYLNHESLTNHDVVKTILAYQAYLSNPIIIQQLKEVGYNLYRLGNIRNNLPSVEPILRDSDFISFDMSSIRHADCTEAILKSPNGLYTEEACQLLSIAGRCDKVMGFHVSGINNSHKPDQSSHLLAQLMWHVLQGVAMREGDYPIKSLNHYKKIFVKVEKLEQDLVFYKNENNNRYWLELPKGNKTNKLIISCSEEDYRAVCLNDLPNRIWQRVSNSLPLNR